MWGLQVQESEDDEDEEEEDNVLDEIASVPGTLYSTAKRQAKLQEGVLQWVKEERARQGQGPAAVPSQVIFCLDSAFVLPWFNTELLCSSLQGLQPSLLLLRLFCKIAGSKITNACG